MEMIHTAIPKDELEVFESLKNIKVVFDVGPRDDVDYLIIKPKIELHCFEPNQDFFEQLKTNVKNYPNVYLNNFGCGNVEGKYNYNRGSQAIEGLSDEGTVQVKRLDKYIEEHNVEQIDFLKIDTEGYDKNVIEGLGDKINICRYIQYEQNNASNAGFERFLPEDMFDMFYIGGRNVIGVRKGEKIPYIPAEPKEGGLQLKTEENYFK